MFNLRNCGLAINVVYFIFRRVFMNEQKCSNPSNGFKEAVCINSGRIYDSCSDKDCLEDLEVNFTPLNQAIINNATSVKCKCVQVYTVLMSVEEVAFNRGFYSVDMTFYFLVTLDAIVSPLTPPVKVEGISVFNKKVILYGSEGNVNLFTSDEVVTNHAKSCCKDTNMPKASISVVNPICLNVKLVEPTNCNSECNFCCPDVVSKLFDDEFDYCKPKKIVYVSIGLFSIVQLERTVQMMIPVYDFCIPEKECVSTTDDPCEMFKKIKFPVNDFFPPKLCDVPKNDCCCNN